MSRRNSNASLYLSGVTPAIRPEEIQNLFEKYGKIRDVYIPRDFHTKEPRGFAYVQFYDEESADQAYRKNEYVTLHGNRLTVQWAQGTRKSSNEMRQKSRSGHRRRSRSPSYSRSRSRSPRRYRSSSSRDRYNGGEERDHRSRSSRNDDGRSSRSHHYRRDSPPPSERRESRPVEDEDVRRRGSSHRDGGVAGSRSLEEARTAVKYEYEGMGQATDGGSFELRRGGC